MIETFVPVGANAASIAPLVASTRATPGRAVAAMPWNEPLTYNCPPFATMMADTLPFGFGSQVPTAPTPVSAMRAARPRGVVPTWVKKPPA